MYPTCVSNGASDRQNAPEIEPLNAASQLFRVRVSRDIEKGSRGTFSDLLKLTFQCQAWNFIHYCIVLPKQQFNTAFVYNF